MGRFDRKRISRFGLTHPGKKQVKGRRIDHEFKTRVEMGLLELTEWMRSGYSPLRGAPMAKVFPLIGLVILRLKG